MVKKSQKNITEENLYLNEEEIYALKITESYNDKVFNCKKKQNVFLSRLSLIQKSLVCGKCDEIKPLSYIKRKEAIDGYILTFDTKCRKSYSIREISFFKNFKLDMETIFKIIYKYIHRHSYYDITRELYVN
ncbi:hypothetical protein DMUE_4325 [Dictyocoela muelleri]|nr:hypothetical protein DMUE_4325 [Dictyocoela muelleri]